MNGQYKFSQNRKAKLGILGGGQLASLLASSALTRDRDFEVFVYVQSTDEPACALAQHVYIGQVNNPEHLKEFFQLCDVVLLESEFFDPNILAQVVETTQTRVFPGLNAYEKLYSKENQKKFFQSIGVSHIPYAQISKQVDLAQLEFEGPYMVKLSHGGYDGYGNLEVKDREELKDKLTSFTENFTRTVLVEKKISIKNEFASLLVKNQHSSVILPPCQTYQEDSICKLVKYPANIQQENFDKIMQIMETLNENLHDTGIFAFEFFEDEDGEIFINEAAPRVHNSYHYTIEGFEKSQFDLFLDAVWDCDLKLPKQCHEYLAMVNILGQSQGENYHLNFPNIDGEYDFKIHMYGKKQSKPGRKLGHVTLYGKEDNFQIAKNLNKEYHI